MCLSRGRTNTTTTGRCGAGPSRGSARRDASVTRLAAREAELEPAQAALLRVFGERQALFRLELVARWDEESGEVKDLGEE